MLTDPRWSHVPVVTNPQGYRDLLAICVWGILSNALDPGTYRAPGQGEKEILSAERLDRMVKTDVNSLEHEIRMGYILTRGQAWNLLAHIENTYCFNPEDDYSWDGSSQEDPWWILEGSLKDYHEDVIATYCGMIYTYKKQVGDTLFGVPCDLELLKLQLRGIASEGSDLETLIDDYMEDEDGKHDMTLLKLPFSLVHKDEKDIEEIELGTYNLIAGESRYAYHRPKMNHWIQGKINGMPYTCRNGKGARRNWLKVSLLVSNTLYRQ